ncbi:PD-(D/E)XK nuclease family protein [Brevundimonas sp. Root1423]|uniref:PD-(D/E)XK nuclease family protein n=1 Tax=Brevundimonas sp. Root1423 TaxID=1736462 RepID=UPI00138F44EC|nr:PD-(D/E)XK nuclease family protein [Brevundimonas sp. Root1423]
MLIEPGRFTSFMAAWRDLRQEEPADDLVERLSSVLSQIRAVLPSPVDVSPVPQAAPIARALVERLLTSLKPAIASARTDGTLQNVWSMAGLKRDEVRNSAVLASLFSPVVSGDRGVAFLNAFLNTLRGPDRTGLPEEEELRRGYTVQTEACPLGAADDRVDLSIEGPDFILLIEVKIGAGEGLEQLSRYDRVLRRKAETLGKRAVLIYLSPTPALAPPPGSIYASWRCVVRAANAVARTHPTADQTFQDQLLRQFAHHARQF